MPIAAAPARASAVTTRASTARSHVSALKRASLAPSRVMSTSAGLTLATSRGRTDHSNAVTGDRAAARAPTAATAAMSPITPAATRRAITILLADRRAEGPGGPAPRAFPGPRTPGGEVAFYAPPYSGLPHARRRPARRRGPPAEGRDPGRRRP